MVNWLQSLLGLTHTEAQYVAALVAIVAGFFTILGTGTAVLTYRWGKVQGWRDHRKHIDRGNMVEADLVFGQTDNGSANFSVVTVGGVLPLHEVFLDSAIEAMIRNAVGRKGHGRKLLPDGPMRHRAYERIAGHITGNERVANQAALFGRHDDCHTDMVAFMLVDAVAEDGSSMSQILKADPAQLEHLSGQEGAPEIIPFRGVHVPYREVATRMAEKFERSKKLFAEVNAKRPDVSEDEWQRLEREAGEKAEVWLVPIRTAKVGASREDVRTIVKEELAAALSGLQLKAD